MTVTSPAPRLRVPRRPLTRRLLATGAAVALLLGVASPATAAVTPSPTPTAPALSGDLELSVTPQSNGVVRPGQSFAVSLDLANGTAVASSAAPASLSIGDTALPDRVALDAWLAGESDPSLGEVAVAQLPASESGADADASVSLAPEDPALAGRGAGVYPVRATATIDGDELAARTVMIVPTDAAPTPVGVVVPITAGPRESGLLTSDQLSALTALDGELTAQLSAVEGTAAILAVDPSIPAAIRVLGSSAPPSAVEWLERLEGLPHSRFALQFGDADVAAQVQAGLPQPLQPTSLLTYMDPADFAPDDDSSGDATPSPTPSSSPTPTPTASVTPAPTGPVYPDLPELLSIGGSTRSAVYWPATASAGPEVVRTLAALGTLEQPALTLVSSSSTEATTTVAARASADGSELLVYDSGVSSALQAASTTDDSGDRIARTVAATAQLAFATTESAGRPLLVTVDRGVERSRAALRAAITAATLAPGVAAVTLEELAASTPDAVRLVEVEPMAERTSATTLLLADEAEIDGFATVLTDPQLLTGRERAEILQLLGVPWRTDVEAAGIALASHRSATAETLDSIGILATNVTLASYDASFRPYVRNDLPYPVTLEIVTRPSDPQLVVKERIEVVAQGASNTRIEVPVQARVGNGSVTLAMQLYSPTGVEIGRVTSATVEVHAEWETIGLVVLVALMVVFIGLGVIRTVLARRARRRERENVTLEPEAGTGDPRDAP